MRKVCLFTSTRADFGLLSSLANVIAKDPELKLQLLVSGTHLSPAHGETVREIEFAGFTPDARVAILAETGKDDEASICQVMGRALAGYGEALQKLSPDLVVILGAHRAHSRRRDHGGCG
jgi:UDP-N-acetylglucosamine 2-epimerase